jgi:hypothetical protein
MLLRLFWVAAMLTMGARASLPAVPECHRLGCAVLCCACRVPAYRHLSGALKSQAVLPICCACVPLCRVRRLVLIRGCADA